MQRLASIFCFVLVFAGASEATATDRPAIAIEGAYLLLQDDGFQRILTLERGGNVTQVSDQQSLIGFTTGKGTWEQIGPGRVKARVIDFAYELDSGKRIGPALLRFDLTFSDLVDGVYQSVSGSYGGEQYATGQNPLSPTEPPIGNFGIGFKGQRITFE